MYDSKIHDTTKKYMTCTLSEIPQVITQFRFSRGDIIKYLSI
jgi:hypothetical protein